MVRKDEKKLNRTYWEWQRYRQKETQRLLKKTTDDRKIPRVDDEDDSVENVGEEALGVNQDARAQESAGSGTSSQERIKSAREIKPLELEMGDPGDPGIDEASLVGPYDDPAVFEAKKAAAARADNLAVKKRGRKKKAADDELSLFNQSARKGKSAGIDPRKKREQLIENLLDPLITLEDAATILNVCKTTVRRYTNKGVLECIRTPGGQRRFKLSQVLDFMARQEDKKGRRKRPDGE